MSRVSDYQSVWHQSRNDAWNNVLLSSRRNSGMVGTANTNSSLRRWSATVKADDRLTMFKCAWPNVDVFTKIQLTAPLVSCRCDCFFSGRIDGVQLYAQWHSHTKCLHQSFFHSRLKSLNFSVRLRLGPGPILCLTLSVPHFFWMWQLVCQAVHHRYWFNPLF